MGTGYGGAVGHGRAVRSAERHGPPARGRLEYGRMRLTNVALMALPSGRLLSYGVRASSDPGRRLPVSFDQRRHVADGQRPGSWMAVAVRLPDPVALDELGAAWDAVVARHGTLRTAFSLEYDDELLLHEVTVSPGQWVEHEVAPGRRTREVLRDVLDSTCRSFDRPAHRVCVVVPDEGAPDPRPAVVVAADHAHVDMWSLLALVRDLVTCLADLREGRPPGAGLPPAPSFAEHTQALLDLPREPPHVRRRWFGILDAAGGLMPAFPLPLGDLAPVPPEVVEVRDVLDAAGCERFSAAARERGVRMIALATSVLTRCTTELTGAPLRAVFPVHSRHEDRWHDSCGWFITNAVIESADPDPAAAATAVEEAIGLGSWPLGPILAPYGGMPVRPGMFALSWLDTRRLPVRVDPALELQYVSAAIRTDGVMVWFVVNDDGMHLRARYPDTAQARSSVGRWLDAVEVGLRAVLA
jgi:hypothetical protein